MDSGRRCAAAFYGKNMTLHEERRLTDERIRCELLDRCVMYKYSWTPRTLDEKSQHALMYLFHLTDQIAPVGRDNRREFWITAKRGSIEDFQPYYDEDATEEKLAEAMQEQYPKEEYWYKFVSVQHTNCRKRRVFGVLLNGKPVLSLNDPM